MHEKTQLKDLHEHQMKKEPPIAQEGRPQLSDHKSIAAC
jgi:hypothetical protein